MNAPYAPPGNPGAIGRVPDHVPSDVTPVETTSAHDGIDPERVLPRDHAIGAAVTAAVITVWTMLAAWRPDVTYHLAPVFGGAAWPVALRRGGPLRVAPVDAARGAVAGSALTGLAALALWTLGLLDGPTLWGDGPAIVEMLPAVAIGAVGGYRYSPCGPSF